jgi:carbon storage regulator
MLVLSRKRDEGVTVTGPCRVTVVEILGEKVRLGFDAPADTIIHRNEVWAAIERENAGAEEVRQRNSNGEPLSAIEADLDYRDNQPRTTSVIPAACVAPEHRQSRSPLVECQENVAEAIRLIEGEIA